MNIKKRIKRVLAGFLRDELSEYGYTKIESVIQESKFDTIKLVEMVSLDNPMPTAFKIQEAKALLAKKIIEHIEVDVDINEASQCIKLELFITVKI